MKAINDYVVIEESKLGTKKSEFGLEFSEALDDESRYRRGTVVDPGRFSEILEEGMHVLYDKKAGHGSPDLPERCKVMLIRDIAVVL